VQPERLAGRVRTDHREGQSGEQAEQRAVQNEKRRQAGRNPNRDLLAY
jgi:hypothetical protein